MKQNVSSTIDESVARTNATSITSRYVDNNTDPLLSSHSYNDTMQGNKDLWNLEGTVYFIGQPCAPSRDNKISVPPCEGPYPNYEIKIYEKINGKNTIVCVTKTDENGNFRVLLKPGEYVIYTQNGISLFEQTSHEFRITDYEITRLSLEVDVGIR
jgi:hypothetical protein